MNVFQIKLFIQDTQKFSVPCQHGWTIESPESPSNLNYPLTGFRVFHFKDITHYSLGSSDIVTPGAISKDLSSWIILISSGSFYSLRNYYKRHEETIFQNPVNPDERTIQRPAFKGKKKWVVSFWEWKGIKSARVLACHQGKLLVTCM